MLSYKTVLNLFLERKLDLLFYYRENMTQRKGVCFRELERDPWRCLVPAGHPLTGRASLSLADLAGEQLLVCHPLNAPRSVAALQQRLLKEQPAARILTCSTIEIAHCMVLAGMGVTLLPSLLCPSSPEFAVLPVEDTPVLSFGVFYHKGDRSQALKKFLDAIDARRPGRP